MFQGAARARAATKADEEEAELSTPAGVDVVSLDEVEAAEEKVRQPRPKLNASPGNLPRLPA